ncbi:MAG: hypothetical protein EOP84_08125 [Verrucomicrobiaceae bacterium]|nr:MAG: hypothetical protein EOP84_08125 [Verrucomicrobiaceae bacterium]
MMDQKIYRFAVALFVALSFSGPAFASSPDKLEEWIASPKLGGVSARILANRSGVFYKVTNVEPGEDLAAGVVSFYLDMGSKTIPIPKEIIEDLKVFIGKGYQLPEDVFLPRAQAAFMLFSEADPAQKLIVRIYEKNQMVSIGRLYRVCENIYQHDPKSTEGADGVSFRLWKYFDTLRKEGTTAAAESTSTP